MCHCQTSVAGCPTKSECKPLPKPLHLDSKKNEDGAKIQTGAMIMFAAKQSCLRCAVPFDANVVARRHCPSANSCGSNRALYGL